MSLTRLVLTLDILLRNIFALYICLLTSLLVVLVFWALTFLHQQELSPKGIFLYLAFSYQQELSSKVVDSLKCFGAQIPYFLSKFENQFYSYSRIQNFS